APGTPAWPLAASGSRRSAAKLAARRARALAALAASRRPRRPARQLWPAAPARRRRRGVSRPPLALLKIVGLKGREDVVELVQLWRQLGAALGGAERGQAALEALHVALKALLGILTRLPGRHQERPVARFQQEQLAPGLG